MKFNARLLSVSVAALLLIPTTAPAQAKKGAKRSTKGKKVAPKYRDPATGETWSGRGKAPKWLAAYLKKGRKKESYLIK